MSEKYRAYPEYISTDTDWLGEAPKHWKTIPVGRLFRRVKRTNFSDKELLSVYRDHGVVPTSSRDDNNNKPSDDLTPYQLVEPNDLVMNKMKAWQGSIAISEFEGIVSPAYFVYQPYSKLFDVAYPKYIHYLLRHPIYIAQYLRQSKGIRVSQWDLDPEEFQRIELLLPDKSEQIKIFNFLDQETAKIDTLIEKQHQLIKLLKEKRQAAISHAVTKGLNPNAPMRDSGVDWLGEVPAHWSVIKLGGVSTITRLAGAEYTSFWKTDDDGAIVTLRGQNIQFNRLELNNTENISEELSQKLVRSRLFKNDIVYPCVGSIGNAALITEDDKFHINQNIAKITPHAEMHPLFLTYFLNSKVCLESCLFLNTSDAQPSILVSNLRRIKVPVPDVKEQIAISKFITDRLDFIDQLMNKAECAVELMQERRIALISAAVTGKIDVRNWQAPSQTTNKKIAA